MNLLKTCLAFLLGLVLGVLLYPHTVKPNAAGPAFMHKVTEGMNGAYGRQVVGFACAQEDCYMLTQ